jgi:hypothetical protein
MSIVSTLFGKIPGCRFGVLGEALLHLFACSLHPFFYSPFSFPYCILPCIYILVHVLI